MFCIHCGKKNDEGTNFCGYCGKAMVTPRPQVAQSTAPTVQQQHPVAPPPPVSVQPPPPAAQPTYNAPQPATPPQSAAPSQPTVVAVPYTTPQNKKPKAKKSNLPTIIIAAVVVLALLSVGVYFAYTTYWGDDAMISDLTDYNEENETTEGADDEAEPTPEPAIEPTDILTIVYIMTGLIDGGDIITDWYVIDENGNEQEMPLSLSDWFTNVQTEKVPSTMDDLGVTNMYEGEFVGGILAAGTIISEMYIDGVEYQIDVSPGARLAVIKNPDGSMILLPEETIALSPSPEVSSDSAAKTVQIDGWFHDIFWDGTSINFTATQEVTIAGISVFVGNREYHGNAISNSFGNMGLSNGMTATPGSSLLLSSNSIIVFGGTVASCEVIADGITPDRVVFFLADGEELEVGL